MLQVTAARVPGSPYVQLPQTAGEGEDEPASHLAPTVKSPVMLGASWSWRLRRSSAPQNLIKTKQAEPDPHLQFGKIIEHKIHRE